jgi:hypothetical protein
MFPLYDDNPTEIFPFATLIILGVTVAVWVSVQGAGFSPEALTGSVCAFGSIPAEITQLGRAGLLNIGGFAAGLALVTYFQNPALVRIPGLGHI